MIGAGSGKVSKLFNEVQFHIHRDCKLPGKAGGISRAGWFITLSLTKLSGSSGNAARLGQVLT